jgi:gliding motility-associated-like protein
MSRIRILVLMTVFSLSTTHSSAVTILYVNVNNTTPGAGTSWATAFTDLNAALTLAATGGTYYNCQIWVAQGTYKPTTTTDRTATFLIQGMVSVYGGFFGNETTLGARNWTANPTILSGDIGVVGNMADNSYNVVTIYNNFNNAILDGFTIQDGNGNQNYPATTALQQYNQAGGVLVIAPTNVYTGATVDHCIIQSNFGVYGGGACTYASGNNAVIEVEFLHDLFQNNTSVMGGGLAWVSTGGGAGLTDAESCIFNANSSPASGGSAIMADVDASRGGLEVDNCTFYNNPAPLFNNIKTNGGSGNFAVNDCIMWQSGGPYTGALSIGTAAMVENCDQYVATPTAGNTNNDPEFVDASAGNFHLQPCSPDIDLGGEPALNSTTDYDGNPRIQNNNIDWGAYETSKTISPTTLALPATYCQNSTAVALTAPGGTNLLWYTAATGGTGSAVAPVPSTATVGATKYWVTQTQAGACESGRTQVIVTVNSLPTSPTAVSPTYCAGAASVPLTATGSSLLWYTVATGGTGSITAPTPSTTTSGSFMYYVTQTDFNNCESPRTPVTVTINAAPAAPVAVSPTYCTGATAVALTATGTNLLWYTAATGGVGSAVAPVPSTTASGAVTYYVSQTSGCESPRAPLTVTVYALPQVAIDAVGGVLCNGKSITLQASGASDYQWSPSAGLSNPAIANPVAALQGDISYVVTGTDANGCAATATITLQSSSCSLAYYVPSAFTPNGDGQNDVFLVKTSDAPRSFSMRIFNRLGQKVFESSDIGSGWDGGFAGGPAQTGAYVYVIAVTNSAGTIATYKGTIMLMR